MLDNFNWNSCSQITHNKNYVDFVSEKYHISFLKSLSLISSSIYFIKFLFPHRRLSCAMNKIAFSSTIFKFKRKIS